MRLPRGSWSAGALFALASFALASFAYPSGAPAGYAGAPRDRGTCANLGCHFQTAVGAGVRVSIDSGAVYRPGQTHTVTIEITDVHGVYGFQLTARFARDPLAMAGTFTAPVEGGVRCGSTDLVLEVPRTGVSCPANAPLEYAGHSMPAEQPRFAVRWTAPASGGDVIFYVTANAANGDTTRSGDRVHAAQLRVTTTGPPSFDVGAVTLATAFPGVRAVGPQAWVEIFGERLAPDVATWDSAVMASGSAPVELAGVRVTVGGQPAFLSYVSPGQINFQAPDGILPGVAAVRVVTPSGEHSQPVRVEQASPGLWAPPSLRVAGRQYAGAQHPDGTFVGPPGFFGAGVASRPARPNDRIVLWAIGLGPVNPPQAAGRRVRDPNALGAFLLRFGGLTVATEYAGLAPGQIGLYQINAIVPDLPPGDYEIGGSVIAGIPLPSGAFINLR
jgi:uncharacterized protein (TIGR03437 family)